MATAKKPAKGKTMKKPRTRTSGGGRGGSNRSNAWRAYTKGTSNTPIPW